MTAIYYFENACAPVPTIMPAYQRVRGSHRRLSKFWSRFVDSFILRRGLAPCEPLPENYPRIITHAEENRARPRLDLRRKLCARAATEDGRRRPQLHHQPDHQRPAIRQRRGLFQTRNRQVV